MTYNQTGRCKDYFSKFQKRLFANTQIKIQILTIRLNDFQDMAKTEYSTVLFY